MTLRNGYATLSHQLAQLDANKQAGQWARLYKQVQAVEQQLQQAEQALPPSQPASVRADAESPGEGGGAAWPTAEVPEACERQEQLRAITSDLLYWKGGLKVLRQAQLPKWRGCFQWQIEARIEALQTAHARLRAEAAKPDG